MSNYVFYMGASLPLPGVAKMDSLTILWTAALALAVPLILLLLRYVLKPGGVCSGTTAVLCGPAESGKTTLFLRLISSPLKVVSSAAVNTLLLDGVTVKDVPGSAKLRDALFSSAIKGVRNLVFVLVVSEPETLHTSMPFIVHVLATGLRRSVRILILAGKADLNHSAVSVLQAALDAELRRIAKHAIVEGGDDETDQDSQLRTDTNVLLCKAGLEDEPDSISVSSQDIPIRACSTHDPESIEAVKQWILGDK